MNNHDIAGILQSYAERCGKAKNTKHSDLKRYRRMTDEERETEHGITAELNDRMRWMPEKWRRIVKVRYIERRSVAYTCMELHIGKTTYLRRTKELAEWLEDTEKYLREQV